MKPMKRMKRINLPETFDDEEGEVLRLLDARLAQPAVREALAKAASHVERRLAVDTLAVMAWEPVPLPTFEGSLPGGIRSCWVFILRGGSVTGAERHPNSRQRMMSYRNRGDLHTRPGGEWQSNRLVDDPGAPMERRWISVPPLMWHQAVVPEADWVVVSFHAVRAEDLVEERPHPDHPDDPARTVGRRYLAR